MLENKNKTKSKDHQRKKIRKQTLTNVIQHKRTAKREELLLSVCFAQTLPCFDPLSAEPFDFHGQDQNYDAPNMAKMEMIKHVDNRSRS
jgi:hypothetical protein